MDRRFLTSSDVDDVGGMSWRMNGLALFPEYALRIEQVVEGYRLQKFIWGIKEGMERGDLSMERLSASGEAPGRYRIVSPEMDVEITEIF